jgi:protease I
MEQSLKDKKIAILATDGVEQSELEEPRRALEEAGATTELISNKTGEIRGWSHGEWGDTNYTVDKLAEDAAASDYDALLLPGGVRNPDKMRTYPQAVEFVKKFFEEGKPVAAICHGPWMLVEANVVEGRKVTSWPSLQTDLRNAGAQWVDAEVIVDQGLVTSRKPEDIPAFNGKMVEEFAEGPHPRQQA